MKKILLILPLILFGCNDANKNNQTLTSETEFDTSTFETTIPIADSNYRINFDSAKISPYKIENSEFSNAKALTKKLSAYSTDELKSLPNFIKLTISIVVPYDITKESLENTLRFIVHEKTAENKDIDEVVIFVYDDKNDIGKNQYTFAKLLWAPNGKTGNVTPEIAEKNNRNNYSFDIIIKDKVGKISKSDLPTDRELKIYSEMMDEKYIDMQEEEYHPMIMKKYEVKTKKELDAIWLKVAGYKN